MKFSVEEISKMNAARTEGAKNLYEEVMFRMLEDAREGEMEAAREKMKTLLDCYNSCMDDNNKLLTRIMAHQEEVRAE